MTRWKTTRDARKKNETKDEIGTIESEDGKAYLARRNFYDLVTEFNKQRNCKIPCAPSSDWCEIKRGKFGKWENYPCGWLKEELLP